MLQSKKDKNVLIVVFSIALFFIAIATFFPFNFSSSNVNTFVSSNVAYIGCVIFSLFLAKLFNVFKTFNKKITIKILLTCIPFFLVAINNFPYISLIKNDITMSFNALELILYTILCISSCLFEEIMFRGILFGSLIKNAKTTKDIIKYILVSSLVFSLLHLLNLFGGFDIVSTVLQLGYSFLLGAMLCVVLLITKNIFICFIIHFIFNFFGSFIDYFVIGYNLDIVTIIITIILAFFAFILAIIQVKRIDVKNIL